MTKGCYARTAAIRILNKFYLTHETIYYIEAKKEKENILTIPVLFAGTAKLPTFLLPTHSLL